MKTFEILSEITMELCYFVLTMRRIGPLEISEDEAELYLQKTTSPEVAGFIKDGIKVLKKYGGFEMMKIMYDVRMLKCLRNPDIDLEELQALQYSVYLFEYCTGGDLDEMVRFSRLLVEFESAEEGSIFNSNEEALIKLRRVQEFLRSKDYEGVPLNREEFETYKKEGWKTSSH
ncbi:hypothetical protein [Saccharibacillus sacchari]|uniref:hypothetical protein n=1 Tax=Saccharibacillus sacchari TaxID=456493 RepID=UPI00056C46DD|nr:hypothetical protein [Saccharibacillus sacchari]